jgi:hypothetical protein
VQSVYAIEDPLTTTAYSDPRTEFRKLKITTTGGQLYAERDQKSTSGSTVACTAPGDSGWYVDLPVSGERVNVDMRLTRPVIMLSNVLGNTARSAGGTSYKNYFDFKYFLANSAATPKLIGAKEGRGTFGPADTNAARRTRAEPASERSARASLGEPIGRLADRASAAGAARSRRRTRSTFRCPSLPRAHRCLPLSSPCLRRARHRTAVSSC